MRKSDNTTFRSKLNSKNNKKPSPVGCIVFLVVIIAAFVFLPVAVGFTVTFGAFGTMLLVSAIFREFKRIRERNQTNSSTISAAREGFVEITGKLVDEPSITTWLTGEKACILRLSFSYMKSSRSSSRESTSVTLFHYESERKKLLISDGSDKCWVVFHAAEMAFKKKSKRFRIKTLKEELQRNPIEGFPHDELDKLTGFKIITVTEEWLEKGKSFNCYGVIRKVKYGERPKELVEVFNHNNQHRFHKEQALTESDWQKMEELFPYGDYKIITSRYNDMSRRDIDPLIITHKGDKGLNRNSYLQIFLMTFALVFLLFMCGVLINAQYPELFDRLVSFLNNNIFTD